MKLKNINKNILIFVITIISVVALSVIGVRAYDEKTIEVRGSDTWKNGHYTIKEPVDSNGNPYQDKAMFCIWKGTNTGSGTYHVESIEDKFSAKTVRKLKYICTYGNTVKWTGEKQCAVWITIGNCKTVNECVKGYGFTTKEISELAEKVDKIIKEAEIYANKNDTKPTLISKDAILNVVINADGTPSDKMLIGPLKFNGNSNSIYQPAGFTIYDKQNNPFSNIRYIAEDGKTMINGLPKFNETFYIEVPGTSAERQINKITWSYKGIKFDNVKLYYLYHNNYEQPYAMVEGLPKEEEITVNPNIPLIQPSNYTINLLKKDSKNSGNLEGAKFKVLLDGKELGTYTSDKNGNIKIQNLQIKSIQTQKLKIVEIEAPQYYEKLVKDIELDVKIKIETQSNGIQRYVIDKVELVGNTENNPTVELVKNNVGSESDYTINLNLPNDRKMIKLSGYVWLDEQLSKELIVNGQKDPGEKFISDIQVTLHTRNNENILYTNSSVMQTKTNKDGYYEFEIPMGPEYYVEFTYNGQNYQHTKYTTWTGNGNPVTSNSTESEQERDNLNKSLETITPNMVVKGTTINNTINEKGPTYIDEECYRISAYTGAYGNEKDIKYYSTTSENINLGLTKREEADVAVRKDLYKAVTSIKGYTQEYMYNRRNLTTDDNGNKYWDISARSSDVYYANGYTRNVNRSDYNYNDSNNANNNLKIDVTYVIAIRNQSGALDTYIRSLAEYYDQDYTYVNAYIGDKDGNKLSDITASEETNAPIGGYKQRVLTGLDKNSLKPGTDMYIYITFSVGTGTNIKLDDDSGKGNMIEITSYSTYYGEGVKSPNDGNTSTYTEYVSGDIAGRVDVDSNPGNATSIDESTFEDDTDRAPYVRFKLSDEERTINGVAWEDSRTESQGNAVIGDGIRQNNESLIDGITVELWDIDANSVAKIWNGSQWVEAKTTTQNGGQYSFSSFVPGNYFVKFIYGGTTYNGQDYKSTKYHTEVNPTFDYNNPDALGNYVETATNYSDARDLYGNINTQQTREYINNLYSGEMTNPREAKLKTSEMYMQAVTGRMDIFIEKGGNNVPNLSGVESLQYRLGNVDFGLQERPKAQLMLTKEVTNVKVTLANGSVLFDATGKATNVMWQNQIPHTNGYNGKLMQDPIVRRTPRPIILTMDEELMHGATIQITYKIKVDNIGEVDYASKQFYYRGEKATNDTAITTRVNKVIDYAGAAGRSGTDDVTSGRNNLKFDASANSEYGWKQYTLDEVYNYKNSKTNDEGLIARSLLDKEDNNYKGTVSQYSTILVKEFNKDLVPKIEAESDSSVETTLVLSQIMSAENSSDDFNNIAEIVSLENGIGRRMQYSLVGNQNPEEDITEVDADGQAVRILPPFGQNYIYYILGAGIAVIAIAGIVIIKRKVLKK